MMRSAMGATVVALAALLVCCSADPHQDQDVSANEHTGERFDTAGHKSRVLEPLNGNNLVREVREIRHSGYVPYLISRRYDFGSPYGGRRDAWPLAPVEYRGYYGDGLPKRNFDEIDRSSLDTFVKKRNFDEIDRSSMPFPYATKRFYHSSNFDKKMYRQEHPLDEIDFSNLPLDAQRPRSDFPLLPRNLF